jgi:hypothetical protein
MAHRRIHLRVGLKSAPERFHNETGRECLPPDAGSKEVDGRIWSSMLKELHRGPLYETWSIRRDSERVGSSAHNAIWTRVA